MTKMKQLNYSKHTTLHTSDLPLSENKSSCLFKNPNKVRINKIKVDNGLIASSKEEKCDFIVHWEDKHVVYIELKGGDLNKAFSQVKNTIKLTQSMFSNFQIIQCVIVCSRMRIPKNDTTMMRLKREMKKLTGNVPIIQSQRYIYTVKA